MTLAEKTHGLSLVVESLSIGLAATPATAHQREATRLAQSATPGASGNDGERVATRRSYSDNREEVIIETYSPSIQWGRFALIRRVRRVTTFTSDGSQTVEETDALNYAEPSSPLRLVQRVVTTVRRIDADSYVTELHVFDLDVNGRLVLTRSEHTSSR